MAKGIKFFNTDHAELYSDQESALKWVIQTQIAPTLLARSRYAEDMLENAIQLGVEQYVILGAGLDTFAFRKPELLKKMKVFEIDHPATQALKLSRIKSLDWEMSSSLNFISVDFSKDDLAETILKSEYDPSKLTFFSWLGVTYYLTQEEILNTFKSIASISPKGSSIVFDYPDRDIFDPDKTTKRVQKMVEIARNIGEPMKTGYKYSEIELKLEKANFLIYEYLTPTDIEDKYFKWRIDSYHAVENINYVLAVVWDKFSE
jgi:methyltransferase (TIGR00027 family)